MQARKLSEESKKKVLETSSNENFSGQRLQLNESESLSETRIEQEPTTMRDYIQATNYQNWLSGFYSQAQNTNDYAQQWAWMQQFYANYYLSLYMNM